MFGSWEVNVTVGSLPQKVATAVGELSEKLVGAEYTPIAYLGSQVVNGTNHAVLAEQLLTTGKDTKNIVLLIFNEKQNTAELTSIERVLESGGELGGFKVDVQTDITGEAKEQLDKAFEGYVGVDVKPIALLGTQVTKGTDYVYVAEVSPVVQDPVASVEIITVNNLQKTVSFADLLANRQENSLGYAFTWLKK